MTIKHLVISGGGPVLVHVLGAIQHLEENNYIDRKEIKSIYGTSAGAIVGVLLCLGFDWETVRDYIIKRPWQDVFPVKVQNIFDAYTKKGVFDIKTFEKCFRPLLDAKDINMDINLEDFYKLSNIELHLFAFEINEYKIHDVSYLTYPKLSLLSAIQMSCALPLLVTPVCIEDKCYIDGGFSCNYPLNYCIESGKLPDEILGFKNKYDVQKTVINAESTILDFMTTFLFTTISRFNTENEQQEIKNEVICDARYLSIDVLRTAASSVDARRELFNSGIETATSFLNKLKDSVQELHEGVP
jgi:predicted acylesterase/phospholipase RssA